MRKRAKVDGNHPQIVRELRQAGYSVRSLAAIGAGLPDIIVGAHGYNLLFEIKQPGERLTDDEQEFFASWPGQRAIARTSDDVLRAIADVLRGTRDLPTTGGDNGA